MTNPNTKPSPDGSLDRAAEQFLQQLEARFENDCLNLILYPRDGTHEKPRADS